MLRRLVIDFYVVALLTLVIGPSVGPAVATGPAPQTPGDAPLAAPSPPPSARIVQENQRPGTTSWPSAELSRGRGTPYREEEPRPAARNATPGGAAPPSEP